MKLPAHFDNFLMFFRKITGHPAFFLILGHNQNLPNVQKIGCLLSSFIKLATRFLELPICYVYLNHFQPQLLAIHSLLWTFLVCWPRHCKELSCQFSHLQAVSEFTYSSNASLGQSKFLQHYVAIAMRRNQFSI